jgi:hypothetical protein
MPRIPLPIEQRFIRAAILFIMLGLLIKALSMPFQPVHYDTNYYLNMSSNFIERGELTYYMWRLSPDTNIIAGSGTGYGVLLLAIWLKIFGFSLMSGYIFMYLVGVLALTVLYFLAREWWDSWIAGVAAVVYAALTATFNTLFYVRMDILGILSYLVVLWLHIYAVRTKNNWLHFAVGIAVIAAAEFHIQVLTYAGALSLYYLLDAIQLIRQQRRIWIPSPAIYYFLGALIAGILYVIIHVLPDPEAYFFIPRNCSRCDPAGLVKELQRYLYLIQWRTTDVFVLFIAIGILITRREQADKHYLTLLLGYVLATSVVSPPIDLHYHTHSLPMMALAVGGAFLNGRIATENLTRQRLNLGVFIATFLVVMQFIALMFYMANPDVVPDSIEYVREYVPEDASVMAKPTMYYYLLDYSNFVEAFDSPDNVNLLWGSYLDFWRRVQPQVFIGEPNTIGDDWWLYMHENDFKQVRDDLWIADDLLTTLVQGHNVPDIEFSSEPSSVGFGDCAAIEWSVTSADSVELNNQPVEPTGTREVCPHLTTPYTLSVFWVGGMETQTVTVVVE